MIISSIASRSIGILNEALATELVCVLRYKFHYFMASGIHSQSVKDEFKEHADEEQEHADWLAERIKQLGGKPEMNPAMLTGTQPQRIQGRHLARAT